MSSDEILMALEIIPMALEFHKQSIITSQTACGILLTDWFHPLSFTFHPSPADYQSETGETFNILSFQGIDNN